MSALTEANREHFDKLASEYDDKPWMKTISQQVGTAILERKDWVGVRWYKDGEIGGREVKLLDYACGTGSITRALGPFVTKVIGMDISENMVWRYNEEAKTAGLEPEQVKAVVGNLLAEEVPDRLKDDEYYNFDIAVVGLGFHHFENPLDAIKRLSERLKPDTGVLLIVDFLPFDEEANGAGDKTIKTGGFTKDNLEKLHKNAGLMKFSFSVVDEPAVMELQQGTRKRTLFISRAKKQPTAWGKLANWVYGVQVAASQQTNFSPTVKVPNSLSFTGGTKKAKQDTWAAETFK